MPAKKELKNSYLRRLFLHKQLSSVNKRVIGDEYSDTDDDSENDGDLCSYLCKNNINCFQKCSLTLTKNKRN
jgi:hypothetical protein